jgi:hypothetical protein
MFMVLLQKVRIVTSIVHCPLLSHNFQFIDNPTIQRRMVYAVTDRS